MVSQEFIVNAKIALAIQKTRVSIGNRIYGHLVEGIIRGHPKYEKLLTLRKDKSADRKKTAAYTKKLLNEQLKTFGMTMKEFNEHFEATKSQNEPYILMLEAEKVSFKAMKAKLKEIPLWKWMKSVRGLGLNFGVKLLCFLRDIKRFPNPSKLRKYCGTVPGLKRVKGKEAHFNPELKGILLGQITKSFLMANSQYRQVYDEKKAYYLQEHVGDLEATERKKANKQKITKGDWTKIKVHNYARKAMVNRFLVELWMAAHLVERIEPPTNPYIVNDPKHSLEPMIVPVVEGMKVPKEQKPREK